VYTHASATMVWRVGLAGFGCVPHRNLSRFCGFLLAGIGPSKEQEQAEALVRTLFIVGRLAVHSVGIM
jgi:hypothetical protein